MAAYAPLAGIPNVVQGQEQLNQNALAEYTRAQQEKQQTALLAQQTQAATLQNQQMQALNQGYKDAFTTDPATGRVSLDPDKLQQSLAKNNAGAVIPEVLKGITGYQASRVDLQKKQQELQTASADSLGNLGYALQQSHYDPQLAHTIIQDHLNDPGLDPQHRQQLLAEQQQIAQNPALIQQIADQWVAQSPAQQAKMVERQKATADTTKATASQSEAETAQQKAEQEQWQVEPTLGLRINKVTGEQQPISGATMPPQMMESKYVTLAQKRDAGQPLASADKAFMKGYEDFSAIKAKAAIQAQASLLTPAAQQMAAQYYSETGALPAGMRSPGATASVLNTAAATPGGAPNVAANKMTYGAETALQKSAIAGPIGQQVTAYNTAIAHANQLREAATALDNGDVRALSAIGNKIGFEFGSDKTTNFNVIKNALAGEVSKVFKGGEASDAEIKAVSEPFSTANSPAQLKGAIDNAVHLMNSKREALQQQYQQGMQGKPNFQGAAPPAAAGTDFFGQFGGKARPQ